MSVRVAMVASLVPQYAILAWRARVAQSAGQRPQVRAYHIAGKHAYLQCLLSDTAPIRTRTWTLRTPATLHRILPCHTNHTIPPGNLQDRL